MINRIRDYILKNKLIEENSKVILGLSGGPDSTFLLHILRDLQKDFGFTLIAAHLDHEWRTNSSADVQFCKQICQDLNIAFFSSKISELNIETKFNGSKEEVGRIMRRFFLEKIAKENNANKIALAHHLQDQEETFLIRLIRGTTLSGLVSMKSIDGKYIRPLLEINKNEIINFLDEKSIRYLIDPSNESFLFLRNRIRIKVLPALKECDKRFDGNFLRTLNKLKEAEDYLQETTEKKYKEILTNNLNEIDITKFLELDNFLKHRILFFWLYRSEVKFELTEKFLHEILRFLGKPGSATHEIHHDWIIEKKKGKGKIIKKINLV